MKRKVCMLIIFIEMLVLIILCFVPTGVGKKAITFEGDTPTMRRLIVADTVFGETGKKQVQDAFAEYEFTQAQKHTDLEAVYAYKIVSCDAKLCVVEVQTEYVLPLTDPEQQQSVTEPPQEQQTEQIWFFANEEAFSIEVR